MKGNKSILALAAFTITLFALVSTNAHAITVSLQQGAAGYTSGDGVTIRLNQATTNQNVSTQIIVGNNSTDGPLRGLFEYDLSPILTAAGGNPFIIDSVSLVLRVTATASTGGVTTYDLHLLGSNLDFNETTVTWNNAPSVAGGSIGTLLSSVAFDPVVNVLTDQTFGSSAAFIAALTNALNTDPNDTIRFIAKAATESGRNFARFDTDEVATVGNRPELIVNFSIIAPDPAIVPEPATASLALLGLGGLMLRRRRMA